MSSYTSYLSNPSYLRAYTNSDGVVYVENESDVLFWTELFSCALPQKKYKITPSTKSNDPTRGKRAIEALYPNLNPSALAAVDSDFDYLTPNRNEQSRQLIENKYVIHTFSFSRESILCSDIILNNSLSKTIFYFEPAFCFKETLNHLSKLAYRCLPLFLYGLNNCVTNLPENELHDKISAAFSPYLESMNPADIKQSIIDDFLVDLSKKINKQQEYNTYITYLESCHLTEENAYRFISGHYLMNKVAETLFKNEIRKLKVKECARIKAEATGKTTLIKERMEQMHNHFSTRCSFHSLIENNKQLINDFFYKKIIEKIINTQN